jgi:hypothetical protein
MALKNYGELKAAVANYLDREDQTANIPMFIDLGETKVYRALRTRENEFTHSLDQDTVPAVVNPIPLPQNFREMHLLSLNGRPLEHISSQQFTARKGQEYVGPTTWYTIIGQELWLYPWEFDGTDPEAVFTIEMIYFGAESIGEMATWQTESNPNTVPESDGTPATTTRRGDDATTRLLLVAPDLLLYAALAEANAFLKNSQDAAMYKAMFVETMNDLRMEDAAAKFSGSTSEVSGVYADGEQSFNYGR